MSISEPHSWSYTQRKFIQRSWVCEHNEYAHGSNTLSSLRMLKILPVQCSVNVDRGWPREAGWTRREQEQEIARVLCKKISAGILILLKLIFIKFCITFFVSFTYIGRKHTSYNQLFQDWSMLPARCVGIILPANNCIVSSAWAIDNERDRKERQQTVMYHWLNHNRLSGEQDSASQL